MFKVLKNSKEGACFLQGCWQLVCNFTKIWIALQVFLKDFVEISRTPFLRILRNGCSNYWVYCKKQDLCEVDKIGVAKGKLLISFKWKFKINLKRKLLPLVLREYSMLKLTEKRKKRRGDISSFINKNLLKKYRYLFEHKILLLAYVTLATITCLKGQLSKRVGVNRTRKLIMTYVRVWTCNRMPFLDRSVVAFRLCNLNISGAGV